MGVDAACHHPVWPRQAVDRCSDIPVGIAPFLQPGEIASAFPVVIVDVNPASDIDFMLAENPGGL